MRKIDADALCDQIADYAKDYDLLEESQAELFRMALRLVAKQPTIGNANVVHGHWIDYKMIINNPIAKCSVCGMQFCDIINNHKYMYRFCPSYNNSCNIDMHDSYVINSIYLKYGKEEVDKVIKQLTTDEVD